ncbi:uncharacterized protein ABDE67_003677 isoform 2-T2 [Symphorus nematophorus]
MTEETESSALTGAADTDVGLTEVAASEETDSKEKLLQEDRQRDRQRDGQLDGQLDGQTAPPPAAEPSGPQSKWVVGASCQAVWSEDGQVYPAKVVCVDGERCRVRFSGYGNEEEVELSALRSPDAARQTQRQNSQDWRPGSRCRAVFSEDGLVYPAAVLWVKGQRCRVRFDDYNNEEEQDVGDLLSPDELRGPSRAAKGSSWRSGLSSGCSNSDWKRSRREDNQGDRGAERRTAWRDEQHNNSSSSSSSSVKDKSAHPSKVEKEAEEKKKATNHCFPFFPPFPPPQSSSGDRVSFIPPPPPPPPLWSFGGTDVDASSSMLMLWYLCGFHTGSYLAQQEFRSSSKH